MHTSSLQRPADGAGPMPYDDDPAAPGPAPGGFLRAPGDPLRVIAHRGASASAPENTLVAQEIARRGGVGWIENDVRPSRDGVPFVLHDRTVDRTTDGTGEIGALSAARLKELDAGSWFAPAYAGTRLPTLAEQLADLRTRGGNLLLEIKGEQTRAQVGAIVDAVRTERMTGRVFVQSFKVDALRYVQELAPELPLGLLRETLDPDPVAVAEELHLTAYNPWVESLTQRPAVIADLHAAGVATMVWTVDSARQWAELERIGVDAVITNRPAELTGWNARTPG